MRKQAAIRQADVLDLLRVTETPMTAHQILERAQADEPDIVHHKVCSVLVTLTAQGCAQKLESIKAFLPRRCEHPKSLPMLNIFSDRGIVEEYDGGILLPNLSSLIAFSKFKPDRHVVELLGHRSSCAA